ncbi:hypothetical protein N7454_007490 [Penicillium verhagenii]|nr:hypothetical protein N7454_007490 [Penicillium verhagenii]
MCPVPVGHNFPVQDSAFSWEYEEHKIGNVRTTANLLARIVIAKVKDEELVQGNPEWRCRIWIASAPAEIAKDGECVRTAELDWENIEAIAREFVGEKTAVGRYNSAANISQPKPTWDKLEKRKSIS